MIEVDLDFADLLLSMVSSFHTTGFCNDTIPHLLQARDIYEKTDNLQYVTALAFLGNAYSMLGDLKSAAVAYKAHFNRVDAHASIFPNNEEIIQSVAFSANKLCNINHILHDLEIASFFADVSVLAASELCNLASSNMDYTLSYAYSLNLAGNIYFSLDQYGKAYEYINRSKDLLAGIGPEECSDKTILQIAHTEYSLGAFHYKTGKTHEALASHHKVEYLLDSLTEKSMPHNKEDVDLWVDNIMMLGDIYDKMYQHDKAENYYTKLKEMIMSAVACMPQNVWHRNKLALSLSKIGSIYFVRHDFANALKSFMLYYNIKTDLCKLNPNIPSFKQGLAIACQNVGDTYAEIGDFDNAYAYYEQLHAISKDIFNKDPHYTHYDLLSVACIRLGRICYLKEDHDNALLHLNEALKICEELCALRHQNIELAEPSLCYLS